MEGEGEHQLTAKQLANREHNKRKRLNKQKRKEAAANECTSDRPKSAPPPATQPPAEERITDPVMRATLDGIDMSFVEAMKRQWQRVRDAPDTLPLEKIYEAREDASEREKQMLAENIQDAREMHKVLDENRDLPATADEINTAEIDTFADDDTTFFDDVADVPLESGLARGVGGAKLKEKSVLTVEVSEPVLNSICQKYINQKAPSEADQQTEQSLQEDVPDPAFEIDNRFDYDEDMDDEASHAETLRQKEATIAKTKAKRVADAREIINERAAERGETYPEEELMSTAGSDKSSNGDPQEKRAKPAPHRTVIITGRGGAQGASSETPEATPRPGAFERLGANTRRQTDIRDELRSTPQQRQMRAAAAEDFEEDFNPNPQLEFVSAGRRNPFAMPKTLGEKFRHMKRDVYSDAEINKIVKDVCKEFPAVSGPEDIVKGMRMEEIYAFAEAHGVDFGVGRNIRKGRRRRFADFFFTTLAEYKKGTYGELLFKHFKKRGLNQTEEKEKPKVKRVEEFIVYQARDYQATKARCEFTMRQVLYQDMNNRRRVNHVKLEENFRKTETTILVRKDLMPMLMDSMQDDNAPGINDRDFRAQYEWTPSLHDSEEHCYAVFGGATLTRDFQYCWEGSSFRQVHYTDFDTRKKGFGGKNLGKGKDICYIACDKPFVIVTRYCMLLQHQEINKRLKDKEYLPKKENTPIYKLTRGVCGCGKTRKLLHRVTKYVNEVCRPRDREYERKWWKDYNRRADLRQQEINEFTKKLVTARDAWLKEDPTRKYQDFDGISVKSCPKRYEDDDNVDHEPPQRPIPYEERTLIVTVTRVAKEDIVKRLADRKRNALHPAVDVRTMDSVLLNVDKKYHHVYVDECYMSHAGAFDIVENMVDPCFVYLFGDEMQIPFIARVRAFKLEHSIFRPYKEETQDGDRIIAKPKYIIETRRCPPMICKLLASMYDEGIRACKKRTEEENRGMCKMEAVLISDPKEVENLDEAFLVDELPHMAEHERRDEIWQTFTQAEKIWLQIRGEKIAAHSRYRGHPMAQTHEYVNTVHENQGRTVKLTRLFRLTKAVPFGSIFDSNAHRLTAVSRNTRHLIYYTVVEDEMYRCIKSGKPLTRHPITNPLISEQIDNVKAAWMECASQLIAWKATQSDDEDSGEDEAFRE